MRNIDLSTQTLDPLTTGFKITGNEYGLATSAGDMNQDGYDDIIGQVWSSDSSVPGTAYIIYGGEKSSLSNIDLTTQTLDPLTTGFVITGNSDGNRFGLVKGSAGDINNDGYAEIMVGTSETNSNTGEIYVVYGGPKSSLSNIDLSTQTLDPLTTGFRITGNAIGDDFGDSVSCAGDVNNDGYDDLIVGAAGKNSAKGAAYVIYGGPKSSMSNIDLSTQTLDPLTTGFMITGKAAKDSLGHGVSSAGDINKDGYDDVIVGALGSNSYQGAIYVIYGGPKSKMSNIDLSTTTLNPLATGFSILGTETPGALGMSVSSADVNNGENPDLLIGAPGLYGYSGAQKIFVLLSQCPKHCDTCSSASTCDVCSQGYDLKNSLCYNRCPTNCETCSTGKSCDVCISPYLLYSGQCFTNCPSRTFASDMKECQNCPMGCSECTSSSTCQNCIDGYALAESEMCTKQIETTGVEEKDIEKATAGTFEGTSLVGAALGSGGSLPLNFGLASKILKNIKYMKLPVSRELQETFVSWKMPSKWVSAPKSWSVKYSSKTTPAVFSRYGLQSAFLMNFWNPLILALIGIAVFGVFKFIEASIRNKKSMLYNLVKQVNIAASNFALIQFYGNLDDLILYFTLEMRSTKFETIFRICSSVIAIVLLLVGVVLLFLHLTMLGKYQRLKKANSASQLEDFISKFANLNLIFKDYKDNNLFSQSFLMINVIRSVISSLVFAILFEHPLIQISVLLALNILMIVYLCWKRSFKELINTLGQIFCEVALLVAHVCVFILALSDHNGSDPVVSVDTLSKCIIIVNLVLLFGCVVLLVVGLGKMLVQSYLQRRKIQQVRPKDSNNSNIFASAKFSSGMDQSNLRLSTNNGLINQSQSILPADSQRNPLKTVPDESDLNLTNQQENSNNYFIRSRAKNKNPTGGFDISSSNIEDIEEANQSNRPAGSRLRELALSRIAQGSKIKDNIRNKSPESKIQDPSLHSKMIVHQDSVAVKEDVSLTNLEVIQDY